MSRSWNIPCWSILMISNASRVFATFLFSICTTATAIQPNTHSKGMAQIAAPSVTKKLWASFNVAGALVEVPVENSISVEYVKNFAAGRERPRKFCDASRESIREHLDEWVKNQNNQDCMLTATLKLLRICEGDVKGQTSHSRCRAIRGLYSGRSPAL